MNKKIRSPLYIQIYDKLRLQIQDCQYPTGHFLPSERELSEQFHVERATVRRALKLLTNDDLIQKIAGSGSKVIYDNSPASENTARFISVSFVLPGNSTVRMTEPFTSALFNDIEIECKKAGYNLFYTNASSFDDLPDIIKNKNIDAVIWVSDIDKSITQEASNNMIPSIVYGDYSDLFTCIIIDNFSGGQLATRHLIQNGHKKIAFISGIPRFFSSTERLKGFKSAIAEAGMTVSESYIQKGDWTYESGYEAMNRLLSLPEHPTAVFAANDTMALGAIKAITEFGLTVPGDISIIGFDNLDRAEQAVPPLTSVGCNVSIIAHVIGRYVQYLVEKTPEPIVKIFLPVQLTARSSVSSLK